MRYWPGRRSAQSAMYRIAEAFVRWIAPILSFTADEMWRHMPPAQGEAERADNVLFATWYEGLVPIFYVYERTREPWLLDLARTLRAAVLPKPALKAAATT